MLRSLLTAFVVGGLWVGVMSLTGCADSNQPYSLTGPNTSSQSRYIDQKGHYRADLEAAGRPTN